MAKPPLPHVSWPQPWPSPQLADHSHDPLPQSADHSHDPLPLSADHRHYSKPPGPRLSFFYNLELFKPLKFYYWKNLIFELGMEIKTIWWIFTEIPIEISRIRPFLGVNRPCLDWEHGLWTVLVWEHGLWTILVWTENMGSEPPNARSLYRAIIEIPKQQHWVPLAYNRFRIS